MGTTESENSKTLPQRRFPQFSLRTLMLGVLVAAYVCSYFTAKVRQTNWLCDTHSVMSCWTTSAGETRQIHVNYAFRFDELVWAVFQSSDGGEIWGVVRSHQGSSWIELPSSEIIHLPGDGQIYEYSEGRLITHTERLDISQSTFDAYLGSNPDELAFDTLKRFMEQQK